MEKDLVTLDRLDRERRYQRLSLYDLGLLLGCSESFLSLVFRGKRSASPEFIKRITKILKKRELGGRNG